MASPLLAVFVFAFGTVPVQAQDATETTGKANPEKLFAFTQTLAIMLHAPWRDIVQREKNMNPYPATIEFSDSLGQSHSIALMVERRGLTRQVVCKFPPIRLRFDREAVKGTVFAGQKSLKMVTHCDRGDRRFIPWFHQQITKYSLKHQVTGVHALSFEPGQLMQAFEDEALTAKVVEQFAAQAKPLVANGVDVILPGGGIPMLLFSTIHGHNVDSAPVMNGIPVVVKMAKMAVRLKRLTGISASRTADFSKPPRAIIEEFLTNRKGIQ